MGKSKMVNWPFAEETLQKGQVGDEWLNAVMCMDKGRTDRHLQ